MCYTHMLIQNHRLFLPSWGEETDHGNKEHRLPLWNIMLGGHSLIAHLAKLLGCPLKTKIPILPAQTTIFITRPIPRILIKWQMSLLRYYFLVRSMLISLNSRSDESVSAYAQR